jgi:hypothetical protein
MSEKDEAEAFGQGWLIGVVCGAIIGAAVTAFVWRVMA